MAVPIKPEQQTAPTITNVTDQGTNEETRYRSCATNRSTAGQ